MPESYPDRLRHTHERWLIALTAIPTAAGREHRVIDWVRRWVDEREGISLTPDGSGNLLIERADAPAPSEKRPLYITAHLDHPAFVVERIVGPGTLELSFRGGVRDPYFTNAPIRVVRADDTETRATIIEAEDRKPFKHYVAELEEGDAAGIEIGDIARWDLPDPEVIDEGEGPILYTHACDDLAALAAALAAFDVLHDTPDAAHVRLFFTRAEEIGFVGATEAMRAGVVPPEARMVLLENSRSFDESPIGGGPIVRVGDRMSTFNPALTAGFAKLAEGLAKGGDEGIEWGGNTTLGEGAGAFRWQRKLMPGGACEATVYQAYGYEATCLCLPLGNYHNMENLSAIEAGDEAAIASARCGREHIAMADFHNLVRLLVAAGTGLSEAPPLLDLIERLHAERRFVLD